MLDFIPTFENDGLAGALAIAKTLIHLKKEVTILMDKNSEDIMKTIIQDYFIDMSHSIRSHVHIEFFE